MEETLRQLGGLLLGAIPTIVLFVILFAAYRALVHKPLQRFWPSGVPARMAHWRKRALILPPPRRVRPSTRRGLREARIAIFKAQEERRQQVLQARAAAVAEARARADQQVKQQKAALAQETTQSKASLQAEAERLASDIIESILRQVGMAQHPVGGGR